MKIMAKIYKLIIISITLQLTMLLFIENVYLKRDGGITSTKYEEPEIKKIQDESIKIPKGVSSLKVSYDANFACFIENKKFIIMDLKKKKNVKEIEDSKNEINYFRWMPDRNILLYATKSLLPQNGYVQIFTLNAETNVEKKLPKITGLKSGEVDDIELSPLTNVIYTKIKINSKESKIYSYDIMDQLEFVMNISSDSVIKEANYLNNLVYQDKRGIFLKDDKGRITNLQKNDMILLEIDSEDKVYVGQLNSFDSFEKVDKIKYLKLNSDNKEWTTIDLENEILPTNIVITNNGLIYIRDEAEKTITDIKTKDKGVYKGEFLEIINNSIVSIYEDSLIFSSIK